MSEQQDRNLTFTETKLFLRINSKNTLKKLMDNGEIGFFQIGNRYLFSMQRHILPYLEKIERKASA